MKLFIKLILLAFVLSYVSLFIIKKPDGTPAKSIDSLNLNTGFSTIKNTFSDFFSDTPESSQPTVNSGLSTISEANDETLSQEIFRWQDEQGDWHYGNLPPAGVVAETMELRAPNVLNFNRTEQNEAQAVTKTNDTIQGQSGGIQEALQQAQQVKDQFQEKLNEQQRVLEEL